jgi:hypothetical protein
MSSKESEALFVRREGCSTRPYSKEVHRFTCKLGPHHTIQGAFWIKIKNKIGVKISFTQ